MLITLSVSFSEHEIEPLIPLFHNYPSNITELTIRLQWPVTNPFPNKESTNPDVSEKTTVYAIIVIWAVISTLPKAVQTCNLEIDLGPNASYLMDTFGEGPAFKCLAKKLRNFGYDSFPQISNQINFIWSCSDGANTTGIINVEHILTKLPSALKKHQHQNLGLWASKMQELEGWVKTLIDGRKVTSCWH